MPAATEAAPIWRPRDAEIVETLAAHFLVSLSTVVHWLQVIDFATLAPACALVDSTSTSNHHHHGKVSP